MADAVLHLLSKSPQMVQQAIVSPRTDWVMYKDFNACVRDFLFIDKVDVSGQHIYLFRIKK